MPKQGLIYRVLIASPSDVVRERQVITDTIYAWNAAHSLTENAILEPVKWETHSRPELGDRPQAIINEQLVQHCDLLIGAFWTRLGTDTGKAVSGTAEEIEQLRQAGKPVLLYFSSAPVIPDSLDMKQYNSLKAFRKTIQTSGLYSTYQDVSDFQHQLGVHLASTMSNLHQVKNTTPDKSVSPTVRRVSSDYTVLPGDSWILASPGESTPQLSPEAVQLLLEAVQDPDGLVLYLSFLGGEHIQTNGKSFGEDSTARERAQWLAALKQLTQHGLLEERGYKGQSFQVTAQGYSVAEKLKASQ